jgi:tetratricopeptide (TPR) repeat protein
VLDFALVPREGRLLHAILLLHLAATTPQARDAEELVHASMRDYDLGHFDAALKEAEQAYRLYPLAQILYNIGQCHRALKHWEQAGFFYERYLTKLPDAPNRHAVEELLEEVHASFRAERLAAEPQASGPESSPLPPPGLTEPASVKPTKAEPSVPPAAVNPFAEKSAEAPSSSHATAYILGSVAVVSLVFMVVGIVEVENFEGIVSRVNNPVSYTAWNKDEASANSQLPAAQTWETVAFATGAIALGSGTGAVLTW